MRCLLFLRTLRMSASVNSKLRYLGSVNKSRTMAGQNLLATLSVPEGPYE